MLETSLNILMQQFEDLYTYTDCGIKGKKIKPIVLDTSFKPLCGVLYSNLLKFNIPEFIDYHLIPIKYSFDPSKRIILFNGGKTSLAIALFMKRSEKYSPILFYVRSNFGRYKAVSAEQEKAVRLLAEKLELPLVVNHTQLSDKNPLFKMRIICEAIKYAVSENLSPSIVLGTYDFVSLKNNSFRFASNSVEFRQMQEKIVNQVIPKFKLSSPLPNLTFVWDELLINRSFIKYIFSETALDRHLMYMYMIDQDIIPETNLRLYIKYMHEVRKAMEREIGKPVTDVMQLWRRYFFYNIEKSKHYAESYKFLE